MNIVFAMRVGNIGLLFHVIFYPMLNMKECEAIFTVQFVVCIDIEKGLNGLF